MLGVPKTGMLGVKVTDYPLDNGDVRRYFTVTNMRGLPEYVPSQGESTVTLSRNSQTLDYVFGETWFHDMVPQRKGR